MVVGSFYEWQHLELKELPKTQYTVKGVREDTVILYKWINFDDYVMEERKINEFKHLVKEGWS
jgi:hypothetical protein